MTLTCVADVESNGLLLTEGDKKAATKLHSIVAEFSDGRIISAADQPGYDGDHTTETLPNGTMVNVYRCSIAECLREIAKAEVLLLVGHNWQGFDHRIIKKFYPWWDPTAKVIDTMHLSRLLYPVIGRDGPNSHKVPPKLRMRHSIEAWGYRLNEKKDKGFDPGDWQTWSPEMQLYNIQDVRSNQTLYKFLMMQKPSPQALDIEQDFAAIIRRQEAWGFTVDYPGLLELASYIATRKQALEESLIATFGEWWQPGKETRVRASRKQKLPDYPNVTQARYNAAGKRLPKDYVGPPLCYWEEGAVYTPITRVEFSPGSREHVRMMLGKKYGWKPHKFTDKGTPQIDDDVLRALPYPEAPMLADYYATIKVSGYVSTGSQAWIKCAIPEGSEHRVHGQVMTIGTYTFRASHFKPNMGQVPTRSEEYGHRCRSLWKSRLGFRLVGFDGSGMQLRLLAHYLSFFDEGKYARGAFSSGISPHAFMRDSIGVDLMGEGEDGKRKGKTMNYALCFGAGFPKLGSIIDPHASDRRKKELGELVKERMLPVWGTAFDELKESLKSSAMDRGYIVGLDKRKARCGKPHTALSTLLQMGEGVVMKRALAIQDNWCQEAGLRPGVGPDGVCRPELADYEFCANVHDEAQADVRQNAIETYQGFALRCVTEAGLELRVRCPLESDVKVGDNWAETH